MAELSAYSFDYTLLAWVSEDHNRSNTNIADVRYKQELIDITATLAINVLKNDPHRAGSPSHGQLAHIFNKDILTPFFCY